jgi:hypothetical protein
MLILLTGDDWTWMINEGKPLTEEHKMGSIAVL